MKLFISGNTAMPPDQLREQYQNAAQEIVKLGHEPLDPFDLPGGDINLPPWPDRIEALTYECDGIYLLSGWQENEQASTERYSCLVTGKQIFYQSTEREQTVSDDRKAAIIERIKAAIHEATGMTIEEYRIHSRKEGYVFARMLFAHYCKRSDLNPEEISICLDRNKSMVYHYFKLYSNEVKFNHRFRFMAQKVDKFLQICELQ
jgi:hypothetical protein